MNDTIFALATPPGRGAIAVIRLSGPGAGEALQALTDRALPEPRRASLRRLRDANGELIDEGIVLWTPGPSSYTGEDGAELQLHGGMAISAAVAARLGELGLRAAEPGEFTRRAFEHGRLDLAQAEAVADLVDAETTAQRRQALGQLGGALSALYEGWRDRLLDVLAQLEAAVDFPDEEIPQHVEAGTLAAIGELQTELTRAAAGHRGERVRDGLSVVLIGAPNAGKSSLLNALLGRDAAIVTAIPGTTRDIVEGVLVVEGQLVRLSDTAGLRPTHDPVEQEGVRRARAAAQAADLRIGVIDRTAPNSSVLELLQPGDILALNKSDVGEAEVVPPEGVKALFTIASEDGVQLLRESLAARVRGMTDADGFPAVTRERHRRLLEEAAEHLQRAQADLRLGPELAAENVRLAVRSLERVTGRTDPEAVLDRVFSSFCIGK